MTTTDATAQKAALAAKIEEFRQELVARTGVQAAHFQILVELIERACQLHAAEPYTEALNLAQLQFATPFVLENIRSPLPPIALVSCSFDKGIRLAGVTSAGINLSGSQLFPAADFEKCTFRGEVNASGAIFRGSNFSECTFQNKARFIGTQFMNEAYFTRCNCKSFAYFDNAQFTILADFSFTRFFNARFNNAKFSDTTSFSGAVFAPWAPQFHGTTLHHDTSFAGATFRAYKHEGDWRAYRTLKQKMADVRAQEEESFFFAQEQRARRKFKSHLYPLASDYLTLGGIKNFLSRTSASLTTFHQDTAVAPSAVNTAISVLYDYGSSYGQNIARPFLWWVLQLVAFTYIYRLNANLLNTTAPWILSVGEIVKPLLLASMLSIQNSLNPLSLFAKDPLVSIGSPGLFLNSMTQAIASIGLITLGLLAIRRRFHKGNE